jgi:hypothetical protein
MMEIQKTANDEVGVLSRIDTADGRRRLVEFSHHGNFRFYALCTYQQDGLSEGNKSKGDNKIFLNDYVSIQGTLSEGQLAVLLFWWDMSPVSLVT